MKNTKKENAQLFCFKDMVCLLLILLAALQSDKNSFDLISLNSKKSQFQNEEVILESEVSHV